MDPHVGDERLRTLGGIHHRLRLTAALSFRDRLAAVRRERPLQAAVGQ